MRKVSGGGNKILSVAVAWFPQCKKTKITRKTAVGFNMERRRLNTTERSQWYRAPRLGDESSTKFSDWESCLIQESLPISFIFKDEIRLFKQSRQAGWTPASNMTKVVSQSCLLYLCFPAKLSISFPTPPPHSVFSIPLNCGACTNTRGSTCPLSSSI